jgi:hypothetical protein
MKGVRQVKIAIAITVIGAVVCGLLVGTASATTTYGTVSTQLIGWPGEVVNFTYNRPGYVQSGNGDVAGVYIMDILRPGDLAPGPAPAPTGKGEDLSDHFNAVCVDLLNVIYPYQRYDWNIVDLKDVPDTGYGPMGPARANDLKELFARHNPNLLASNAQKAAMGVLAWEIVLENEWTGGATKPWGLGGGYLTITGLSANATTYFNTWVGELTGVGATGEIYAIVNPTTQDFGIVLPGSGLYLIPEPLTMLGVFAGCAGLAGYIRRRRLA